MVGIFHFPYTGGISYKRCIHKVSRDSIRLLNRNMGRVLPTLIVPILSFYLVFLGFVLTAISVGQFICLKQPNSEARRDLRHMFFSLVS